MNTKLKWTFLLGMGLGLLLSSSIHLLTPSQITEEFIRREANKLGMIDPKSYFNKGTNNANSTKTESSKEEDNAILEKKNVEAPTFIVAIPKGASGEEIAKILKSYDLIASEKDFLDKIYSKKLSYKLLWGDYEFSPHVSEEEILKAITQGPK